MNRLRHRRLNRICFTVAQHPKSKKSISQDEKKEFQQQVLEALQRFKRRAFRSPVIVELHFRCNQNNPPAIHTLAKNYLDLLSTPVQSSNIKRKSLLYSDDRLIKILIVNYHLAFDIESDIFIRIDSFRNFIEDIRLVDRIIYNDFEEYDSSYSSFDIDEIEKDDTTNSSDWHGRLEDLNRDKEHIISGLGEDVYNTLKDFNIQDAQKDYLEIGRISLSSLSFLFRPYFDKATQFGISETLESLSEQNRNMMISPPLALDLNHIPIEDGGTRIFKNNVVDILEDFKKHYPLLSPLKVPLGVIVLYVPPREQSIDLDNLARYIIPFINQTLNPPISFANGANSINRYQFIQLPRFDSDSDAGYVRLLFDNPFTDDIWRRTDNVIDKWEDGI